MRKVDLQQQAVKLISQLSTEKLREVVEYLVHLQDKEKRNILPTEVDSTTPLGTAIYEVFKPFGGVKLNIPPRELMREPPHFDA
jgi:hypothetical protein